MNYMRCMFATFAMLLAVTAQAEPSCEPTVRVKTTNYPGAENIHPTNNLLLPSGKSIEVEGQRLIISGRVVDARCAPIPDAVVELWQVDPYGKWFVAKRSDLATPDPTFSGAGRTVTDPDGRFIFTTAFPGIRAYRTGKKGELLVRAPQVNLRVAASGMSDFSTTLFFENDQRNTDDVVYKKISIEKRDGVTLHMNQYDNGDLNGAIEIVLPGRAPYRSY